MKSQTLVQNRFNSLRLSSPLAVAHAVGRQLQRWSALSRQRRQLAALSDHALKDIGLSRADIETEINRPFWDEPFRRG